MVPRSTIHKQKKKFFALVPISLCFLPPTPIFLKTTLKCLRSSIMKCSDGMRRSNSSSFICKRQLRPVVQSIQLRKPEERQRPKLRKRLKSGGLQKRRSWSIFNDSGTR